MPHIRNPPAVVTRERKRTLGQGSFEFTATPRSWNIAISQQALQALYRCTACPVSESLQYKCTDSPRANYA